MLRLLVLAADRDARRQVRDAHRGVRRVDRLPARARRAEDVDAQVLLGDLDLRIELRQHRHDVDERERGLPAGLRVERTDAHEPVHPVLGGQPAVRVSTTHLERGRLQAGLLAVGLVEHVRREAARIRPAQVHPLEHLRPVHRVNPTLPGVDRHDRIGPVVLARQHGRELEPVELGHQRRDALPHLRGARIVLRLSGELVEHLEIVQGRPDAVDTSDLLLAARELGRDGSSALWVIPQPRLAASSLSSASRARATSTSRTSARFASRWRSRANSS